MGKATYRITGKKTGASAGEKPQSQRPAVEGFLLLLRELQKIDPEFPLQYAVCLCEIAMDEGLSLTRLAQKTGMALSTVSRIVGALARDRQKGPPYGLVRVVVSAAERRRRELYLTARGKAVIDSIADLAAR